MGIMAMLTHVALKMEYILFLILFCFLLKSVQGLNYEPSFNLELYESVLNSNQCDQQLRLLLSSPHLMQQFIEVNANIPHDLSAKGVLTYNGDYFGCLAIHEHVEGIDIQGKYCQVTVDVPGHINNYEYKQYDNVTWQEMRQNYDRRKSIPTPINIGCETISAPDQEKWARLTNATTIALGVCIPEPCTAVQSIDIVLDTERKPLTVEGKVIERKYTTIFYRLPSDKPISSADYIFIIFLTCVILLAITGTIYDLKNLDERDCPKVRNLIRSFSVSKNINLLLKNNSSSDTVECADGIRAIAMIFIIRYHCCSRYKEQNYNKFTAYIDFLGTLTPFCVDTFLLLGGIFSVYSPVIKYKKRQFVTDIHMHLLSRLVRLYPMLCLTVLINASFLNHVGDGPLWYVIAQQVEKCRVTWWQVLLLIQNITRSCYSRGDPCLNHCWYISLDMQLFLVSTLVLIWMLKNRTTAWTTLLVAVILSMACSTTLSSLYNFKNPIYLFQHPEGLEQKYKQYYFTLCRSPPYFIGMIVGYFLACLNEDKQRNLIIFRINKMWVLFLWFLAMFLLVLPNLAMTVVFWDYFDNQVLHNLINSNMMVIWSLGVSWVIIACHCGYGGPVNWFLSLKHWKLLSRLSYAMYLLHYTLVMYIYSIQSTDFVILKSFYFTAFQNFLIVFFITFIFSFMATVLVEIPVLNLYKLLRGQKKPMTKNKYEDEDKENTGGVTLSNICVQNEN